MSIEVQELSKIYGQQKAVNEISFSLAKGEIVGFLGPNGAGKSTTMKMLTTFIPPSIGTAKVAGYDVVEQAMEVRKRIGYLPEHNPLYPDMYVKEYLHFVAKVQSLGKNAKNRVAEMIETTGLTKEASKKIGQLSKGYRQRVGLAQAMIHDPEVLVLDEPTSGLDPNQLADIRQLILTLGAEKTVLLSTHIMQEVEAMCDRVLIINLGNIVANEGTSQLRQRGKGAYVHHFSFDSAVSYEKLKSHFTAIKIDQLGKNSFRAIQDNSQDIRAAIFDFAVANDTRLLELRREESKLEEVFRDLTKNPSPVNSQE